MNEIKYDVIILGSGLSGTILGTILVKEGFQVIMIDSKSHPRFAIGESTIPHTSLLLSLLAQQYGVPEIDYLAYPDLIARHVCTTCGIKRAFSFAYHHFDRPFNPQEGHHFGTTSKDENHLYRPDVDAYMFRVAIRYGVTALENMKVSNVAINRDDVQIQCEDGQIITGRYVVDGTGFQSVLARQYNLRENPPAVAHQSRSLFTHMTGVRPFEPENNPMILPWAQSTLHHVFPGGWIWVIPFNNREGSTNPITSVGLTLDPRVYPRPDIAPGVEFQQFLDRLPDAAVQFQSAVAVYPWVSTGRLQYTSRNMVGFRYCLMSHAAGFVDPLFSRGLINTLEVINALLDPLIHALRDDNFSMDPFRQIAALQKKVIDYNDALVSGAFRAWDDFNLWDAWLRVWALGTILTEYRLMNALTEFTQTNDRRHLHGEAENPAFSTFEDPDYAAFFRQARMVMEWYTTGHLSSAQAGVELFSLTGRYPFSVLLRRESMLRAGWLEEGRELSERNIKMAREGYRWALTNPTSRDLFGTVETFLRWRSHRPDPHLA